MAAEKVVRDVADVYNKIFNHHGPISKEVNFYVQEFETKRKDRELSRLNQASVHCKHIETLLPEVNTLSDQHLAAVLKKTDEAVKKCNAILGNKLPEENAEKVEERRRRMEEEWSAFENETNASRADVEQCHVERMEKLNKEVEHFVEQRDKGK